MKRGNVLLLAMLCHEANRAYCVSTGDQSQLPWDATPANIQESAVDGVKYALNGSDPYGQHENWMKFKLEDGWTYGPVKDIVAKTHPCLVPYDQLPLAQRDKDKLFLDIVNTMKKYLD